MSPSAAAADAARAPLSCPELLTHLRQGDFSLLAPAFLDGPGQRPLVVRLHAAGCFAGHPAELAEALSCAAFLGAVEVAEYLVGVGVAPAGGDRTGLNSLHWAANRAQLATTRLLLQLGVDPETRNSYGGTVLGATVWAALHETKPAHPAVIALLLESGAKVGEAAYPTGDHAIDALLERFGAGRNGG